MRRFANSGDIEQRQRTEAAERAAAERRALELHQVRERLKHAGAVVNAELSAVYVQRWRETHVRRRAS